jgi:hypothetical protein
LRDARSSEQSSDRSYARDVLPALLLTNRGSDDGWQVVVVILIVAPIAVAMSMRYLDRRRSRSTKAIKTVVPEPTAAGHERRAESVAHQERDRDGSHDGRTT